MRYAPSNFFCLLFGSILILFSFSCKKEQILKNEDKFVEQTDELSVLNAEVSSASREYIELKWDAVTSTHFKTVSYTIFLDDQKIIEGLTTTKYSLINLKPGQAYSVKIVASTSDGKSVQQVISAKTLASINGGTQQSLYKEYSIHSYSRLTGSAGMQRLADGGHLIVRFLQHTGLFSQETFKLIVFRIDKNGEMLWYRLISADGYSVVSTHAVQLALHNNQKEGILFAGRYITKLDAVTGEILMEKDYLSSLSGQVFQSAFYDSTGQILAGTTGGALFSINPQDLTVNWQQLNQGRPGEIVAIRMDSQKNIYYLFRGFSTQSPKVSIHKCSPTGVYLNTFGKDEATNESDWFFWMTSLLVDENDNVYMFGHEIGFQKFHYFKFNSQGTMLKKSPQNDPLTATHAFFNGKGEIIVAGRRDGGGITTYGAIYVLDKDLNIKTRHIYDQIPINIINGVTGNQDGSYNIFLHYRQSFNYDNPNFVFIKTDENGKM